jgi:hypothetical protein
VLFPRDAQIVKANGVVDRVFVFRTTTMTVPLRHCAARFTVTPTRIPGRGDERRLGVHFLTFEYIPS